MDQILPRMKNRLYHGEMGIIQGPVPDKWVTAVSVVGLQNLQLLFKDANWTTVIRQVTEKNLIQYGNLQKFLLTKRVSIRIQRILFL